MSPELQVALAAAVDEADRLGAQTVKLALQMRALDAAIRTTARARSVGGIRSVVAEVGAANLSVHEIAATFAMLTQAVRVVAARFGELAGV